MRDIDIPKLYFNKTKDGNYEVVDGQQRLWAIWEFLDGTYPIKFGGKTRKFTDLTQVDKDSIKHFELQITVMEEADDEYLRELFIRLQLGLLLITGEKLHAASGKMKDYVFDELAKTQFIKNIGIPGRRYSKETLCAQICINSFSREKIKDFSRTRYDDLQYFFREYVHPQGSDLDFFIKRTKSICNVISELGKYFDVRAGELKNRSFILSVYLFLEELLGNKSNLAIDEQKIFVKFVLALWKRLKEEAKAGFNRKNKELYTFETFLSSAPGEKYQIERRHGKLMEYYEHFSKTKKIKGD
jgi:hypothetical protein